jgi:vacuolar protein sorting-associated protein 13A/C
MSVVQLNGPDIHFVSTPQHGSSPDNDLLRIAYTRVQNDSPEFLSMYDGIDQNVDIKMSTLVFRAAPEPVLALYDFIMTTFVSNGEDTRAQGGSAVVGKGPHTQIQAAGNTGVIRVSVSLDGVRGTWS